MDTSRQHEDAMIRRAMASISSEQRGEERETIASISSEQRGEERETIADVSTYDWQFAKNVKAVKTYLFVMSEKNCGDGPATTKKCSIHVDVDLNGEPVAISFIHHKDAAITYNKIAAVVDDLYEFSMKLIDMKILMEKIA